MQLGTTSATGELSPLPMGLPIEAGATVEVGSANVVRLSGLTDATAKDAKVTLTGYFGDAGTAEFTATVN